MNKTLTGEGSRLQGRWVFTDPNKRYDPEQVDAELRPQTEWTQDEQDEWYENLRTPFIEMWNRAVVEAARHEEAGVTRDRWGRPV